VGGLRVAAPPGFGRGCGMPARELVSARGHGLGGGARKASCRSRARGWARETKALGLPAPSRTRAPGPVGRGPFDPFGSGRGPCEARARLRRSPRPRGFRAARVRPGGARRALPGGGLPRRGRILRVRARPSQGALPERGDAPRGPFPLRCHGLGGGARKASCRSRARTVGSGGGGVWPSGPFADPAPGRRQPASSLRSWRETKGRPLPRGERTGTRGVWVPGGSLALPTVRQLRLFPS